MKEQWQQYLEIIGITGLFFDRVGEVLTFYEQVAPDIEDIFVTDYFDKEGARQYESLWLFSATNVYEAKTFLTEDDYDSAPIQDAIVYWNIKKADYDFLKATSKSRMTINLSLKTSTGCKMRAARENCDFLRDIFRKNFVPNMVKVISAEV